MDFLLYVVGLLSDGCVRVLLTTNSLFYLCQLRAIMCLILLTFMRSRRFVGLYYICRKRILVFLPCYQYCFKSTGLWCERWSFELQRKGCLWPNAACCKASCMAIIFRDIFTSRMICNHTISENLVVVVSCLPILTEG